jgi:hypothetical protein
MVWHIKIFMALLASGGFVPEGDDWELPAPTTYRGTLANSLQTIFKISAVPGTKT